MATTQPNVTSMTSDEAQRAEQAQIERNIASILSIPYEQMPWPAVRNDLFGRILSGAPIHATGGLIYDATYAQARCDTPRAWARAHGFAVDDSGKEA